jgi:hypothetical protein
MFLAFVVPQSAQRALNAQAKQVEKTVFIQSKSNKKSGDDFIDEDAEERMADSKAQDKSDDEEEDVDDFGEDPELAAIKAKRMAELQQAFEQTQLKKMRGHGEYLEVTQDEFLIQGMNVIVCTCECVHLRVCIVCM